MYYKTDKNQGKLLETLRQVGGFNQSLTNVGGGVPDQIIAFPGFTILAKDVTMQEIKKRLEGLPVVILDGANVLAEVKQPGENLRQNQEEWHDRWRYYGGQCTTIRTKMDVLRLFGIIEV